MFKSQSEQNRGRKMNGQENAKIKYSKKNASEPYNIKIYENIFEEMIFLP